MVKEKVVGDVSERILSTFEWRVPKWKSWLRKGGYIAKSPEVQIWGAKWTLSLYYDSKRKTIEFCMECYSWEHENQVIGFKLIAGRHDETEYTIFDGKFEFTIFDEESDHNFEHFLTESNLSNIRIASGDDLTMFCVLYENRRTTDEESSSISSEDEQKCIEEKDDSLKNDRTTAEIAEKCPKLTGVHKLVTDLKNLLSTEEDTDVSIMVKDREFKVHKSILRARSSVFYSMFKHDMTEKSSGTVEISDCDPEAFQKFLQYLYTGLVEDLSIDIAVKLYCVADKYDADEVKEKCVEFMKGNLSVETFCGVVAHALEHGELALLETATEFFSQYMKEIIVTVQWQSFLKENTEVANELHIKAMDNYVICKKKMKFSK